MAKRGSSDLTSQIGSILRTTLQQLDTVGKVVVQKGKAGKIQFDLTMLRRKRKDALAALGEATARLAVEGRLPDDEFPELSRGLADLEAVDERIEAEERRARATAAGLPDDLEMPDLDQAAGQAAGRAARRAAAEADDADEAAPEEYDEPAPEGEDLGDDATADATPPERRRPGR